MTEPTAKIPSGRGLKIALAVSLALNLAVAGLVAGAWLSDHGPRRDMPRDLSFGPFTEALSPQDRRALRREFLSRVPEFRAARQEARAEFDRLLVAAAGAAPIARVAPDEIEIRHHMAGDVHVFTAADGMPGLFHAHVDLERAFATLCDVTAELVRLQWGVAEIWFASDADAEAAGYSLPKSQQESED